MANADERPRWLKAARALAVALLAMGQYFLSTAPAMTAVASETLHATERQVTRGQIGRASCRERV